MLILLLTPVGAAVIHGTVYSWETLKPLPKAIVVINTTPEQRMVTRNGSYRFVVPPGSYVIKAYYYKNGRLVLYDEENVTVERNGSYVIDLILFPPLNISEDIPSIQISLGKERSGGSPIPLLVIPAIAAVITLLYVRRRRFKFEELPEDLKTVVEAIREAGGRITQKELRKKLGYSEAKMSLILTDLERRGIIEKVRKGRGNVIFLLNGKDRVK